MFQTVYEKLLKKVVYYVILGNSLKMTSFNPKVLLELNHIFSDVTVKNAFAILVFRKTHFQFEVKTELTQSLRFLTCRNF